jgi:transposase
MSLHPHVIAPVPEETARVARAAFPKGHPYLTFRDALGTIFQDEDFAALFPLGGQPGLPPWRLAFVTIMQFRETLADRQAAEAVRARIDWKYLLSLELTDPGFDFSVLSEFRDRLLGGSAEELLLDKLLGALPGAGPAQGAGAAAHRLHPRAGRGPCPQPARTRRRNFAGDPECTRDRGPRLAARRGASRVV